MIPRNCGPGCKRCPPMPKYVPLRFALLCGQRDSATAMCQQGIGCDKASIVPMPSKPPAVSAVVEAAHELGLFVHCYTFRTDPHMLHR